MITIIPHQAKAITILGPNGNLDCLVFNPEPTVATLGYALIFHPDPQGGGSFTNKVIQTVAKTLSNKGYICYCPNILTIEDAQAVYNHGQRQHSNLPLILAGFSFGAMIASNLVSHVTPYPQQLILIGPAVSRHNVPINEHVPTIVIHGEDDEVIPLADVLIWARKHQLPIILVPETGHFFHGKLKLLTNILLSMGV